MKVIKKIMYALIIIILIVPAGWFNFLLFIGPALNDVRAASIENELLNIAVPADENIYPEPGDYMRFPYLNANGHNVIQTR